MTGITSNSRVAQKLIAIGLILSLCFLVACGKSSTVAGSAVGGIENDTGNGGGTDGGSNPGEVISGPKACYTGDKNVPACATLKTINASKEGYKNPYSDPSFMSTAIKDQYRMPIQAIDLKRVSPSLKISPNFMMSELMSLDKGNIGIFSPAVLKIIQQLRDKIGSALKINSAYRSPAWNQGIDGSAQWSRHQYGDGVDIKSSGATLDQLVKRCRELGATYIDKYVAHVHCDWRNKALDPVFFGAVAKTKEADVNAEEHHHHLLNELTEKSQIKVSGAVKLGNIVRLHSTVTYQEDEEELYKKWTITAPNGDVSVIEESEVSLSLQQSGTYQIVHEIGANIVLTQNLYVN